MSRLVPFDSGRDGEQVLRRRRGERKAVAGPTDSSQADNVSAGFPTA